MYSRRDENARNGVRAVQPSGHVNFTIADGEMNQCAVGKAEQRLGGFAFGMGIAIEASPTSSTWYDCRSLRRHK